MRKRFASINDLPTKEKIESLNSKAFFMKHDLINKTGEVTAKEVVIPDECGDTMWDAVLQQEAKACDVKVDSENAASLLTRVDAV